MIICWLTFFKLHYWYKSNSTYAEIYRHIRKRYFKRDQTILLLLTYSWNSIWLGWKYFTKFWFDSSCSDIGKNWLISKAWFAVIVITGNLLALIFLQLQTTFLFEQEMKDSKLKINWIPSFLVLVINLISCNF